MSIHRPDINPNPSCSESRSVRRCGALNVVSADDVLVDICYTTTSGCCHHTINCLTFDGNEFGGKENEPMVDNYCRSAHLCCRDNIAWNSRVFPPLHSVSGTRRHIVAYTVCCRQFMISTHCRSMKFLMSRSAFGNWWQQPQLRTLVPCAICGISLMYSEEPTSTCTISQW